MKTFAEFRYMWNGAMDKSRGRRTIVFVNGHTLSVDLYSIDTFNDVSFYSQNDESGHILKLGALALKDISRVD